MPILTHKQESFAQAVADGKTLADAYREAYNTSRSTEKSIWEAAASLMANVKVTSRVNALRAAMAEKAMWRREDSVRVLSEVAGRGEKDADRVRAVAELNSMHGYDAPKKVAMTDANGNDMPAVVQVVYVNIGS